jgi:hypothetical protein
MEYPEETIAIGAKGKKEARVLERGGKDFVVYGYVDVETGKKLGKYSILLRDETGRIEHLFVIPTAGGRELVVKHEIEEKPKKRGIYDEKTGKMTYF